MQHQKRMNVLLIVSDTTRAKTFLPMLERGTLSGIEKIAKRGTKYTQAISVAPWTLPSHASLFSGQYPSSHRTYNQSYNFTPSTPTLSELLADAGYQTVGISNNAWISSEFNFDRGFNEFYSSKKPLPGGVDFTDLVTYESTLERVKELASRITLRNSVPSVLNAFYAKFIDDLYDNGAFMTNLRAKNWIKNRDKNRPFFMFINYLEPHLKYDPPTRYKKEFMNNTTIRSASRVNQDAWSYIVGKTEMTEDAFDILKRLYKAEIAYLDSRLENLFQFLSDQNILDNTLVIVTGDHGENIGEHELMDHQYSLHETLVHVPLVMRLPGVIPEGKSKSCLVELRDIYPSVLDILDLDIPSNKSISHNIIPREVKSAAGKGRAHAVMQYLHPQPDIESLAQRTNIPKSELEKFDQSLISIRTKKWKYIEGSSGKQWLYDLEEDKQESYNLKDNKQNVVSKLKKKIPEEVYSQWEEIQRDTKREQKGMGARTKQQLKKLGYLN